MDRAGLMQEDGCSAFLERTPDLGRGSGPLNAGAGKGRLAAGTPCWGPGQALVGKFKRV